MNVTKNQMITGLTRYIEDEVISKIDDKPLRIILAVAVNAIRTNSSLVDSILMNDLISVALEHTDDGYNVGPLMENLKDTLNKYGEFPITIPPVKFISPNEKILKFSADDVGKLESYIMNTDPNMIVSVQKKGDVTV